MLIAPSERATAHPTPLLTVSVPLGLQYGGTAGSIINQSRATNSSSEVVGLQVSEGKTLALVGGDVRLDGGNLQAPGGRVELGGVAGAGTVRLSVDGNNLGLSFPVVGQRSDVSLTNDANVYVLDSGGGSIAINAQNLNVLGGSSLRAGIAPGLGSVDSQAGDITLNATEAITIAQESYIANMVAFGAVGNGGSVNIATGSLSLTNNAQLSSTTLGQGDAGSVIILARDTVSFDGEDRDGFSTGVFTVVPEEAVGKGGSVNIITGSLSLTNGAQVLASTFGQGDAGSVTILARDTVSFDGEGGDGNPSGAFSTVEEEAVGKGGGVNITTGSLSLTNGAELAASSAGSGAAGNIEVSASSIRLNNGAFLGSNTVGGEGNIRLRSPSLILRRGSSITTNATGNSIAGGNITIDTDVLAALENSDISANSDQFFGGEVRIDAQGIFGTKFRDAPTPESDITATGGSPEFSGTVEINTPDVDPSQGLVELPVELVDASRQIATSCAAVAENKFIITGRGGLPPGPSDPLRTDAVRVDSGTPIQGEENRASAASTTNLTNPAPTQIVEAQGWVVNNLGEVVLTASAPNATPHIPWLPDPTCHTSSNPS